MPSQPACSSCPLPPPARRAQWCMDDGPDGSRKRTPAASTGRRPRADCSGLAKRSLAQCREAVTLESQRGRVVLLNFWVFQLLQTAPHGALAGGLRSKYRDRGLTIVAFHPGVSTVLRRARQGHVQRALREVSHPDPNAQDNDSRTWDLYGIRYWPSFVLIDKKGRIRYEGAGEFHVGDASYQLWDGRIRGLLEEQ